VRRCNCPVAHEPEGGACRSQTPQSCSRRRCVPEHTHHLARKPLQVVSMKLGVQEGEEAVYMFSSVKGSRREPRRNASTPHGSTLK